MRESLQILRASKSAAATGRRKKKRVGGERERERERGKVPVFLARENPAAASIDDPIEEDLRAIRCRDPPPQSFCS